MEPQEIFIYLGKTGIAISIFYLAFQALFKDRKHFVFNRFYLLSSFLLSFIFPLITFTVTKKVASVSSAPLVNFDSLGTMPEIYQPPVSSDAGIDISSIIFYVYFLGILICLIHLILGYIRASIIVRNGTEGIIQNQKVCITQEDLHPFSFFNKIIISKFSTENPKINLIIHHENVHVQEKHTLDMLFSEILFMLQWFNPFAWLMKELIKNNLEFIADKKVTEIIDRETYQLAMLSVTDKKGIAPFLTALNGSLLRKRIIMMKKKEGNKKMNMVRKLLIIPILVILILALSNKEFKAIAIDESFEQSKDTIKNIGTRNLSSPSGDTDCRETEHTSLDDKILERKPLIIIDGKETGQSIKNIDPNIINSVTVLQENSATILYGEKAKDGVILITTGLNGDLKKWFNGIDLGKNDKRNSDPLKKASDKPLKFSPFDWNELMRRYGSPEVKDSSDQASIEVRSALNIQENISEISGKVINRDTKAPIAGASIIIKGETTGTITNKDGEFEIQLKDPDTSIIVYMQGFNKNEIQLNSESEINIELEQTKVPRVSDKIVLWKKILEKAGIPQFPAGNEPLVVQDGIETLYKANDIAYIYNPEIIRSVSYTAKSDPEFKLKDRAKNGIIYIKTNLDKAQDKRLYIIDGEEVFLKDQRMNVYIYPKSMKSSRSLPPEEAVKKYGRKAKHGAVDVITSEGTATNPVQMKINSIRDLRTFLAFNINYPEEARQKNQEIVITRYIKISSKGQHTGETYSSESAVKLDPIVIPSYRVDESLESDSQNIDKKKFNDQINSVFALLPTINIPELYGKSVRFEFKFVLH